MLKGIDISHHNNLDRILSIIDRPDFCIIKATEGKTFTDPKFKHNIQICRERNIPIGFYHYARPERNLAVEEARHFIDKVAPYLGECILALDWEDKALNCPVSWAKQFLDYIKVQTGVTPLIYCSASYTPKLKPIFEGNYGLWVAHYTRMQKPVIGVYPFWAFWQYSTPQYNFTDGVCPCDFDYFNGNLKQLEKYMSIQR